MVLFLPSIHREGSKQGAPIASWRQLTKHGWQLLLAASPTHCLSFPFLLLSLINMMKGAALPQQEHLEAGHSCRNGTGGAGEGRGGDTRFDTVSVLFFRDLGEECCV